MIFGIGIELVEIARIQHDLDHYGDKFPNRILGSSELERFATSKEPANFLAKYFAVKEATFKAFGIGQRHNMPWQDIHLRYNELGHPTIGYAEKALEYIKQHNVSHTHLSISEEKHYAIAYVLLEANERQNHK